MIGYGAKAGDLSWDKTVGCPSFAKSAELEADETFCRTPTKYFVGRGRGILSVSSSNVWRSRSTPVVQWLGLKSLSRPTGDGWPAVSTRNLAEPVGARPVAFCSFALSISCLRSALNDFAAGPSKRSGPPIFAVRRWRSALRGVGGRYGWRSFSSV